MVCRARAITISASGAKAASCSAWRDRARLDSSVWRRAAVARAASGSFCISASRARWVTISLRALDTSSCTRARFSASSPSNRKRPTTS
jgi:hypothetical protein